MTEQQNQSVQLPIFKYFILNFIGFTIPLYPSFLILIFYRRFMVSVIGLNEFMTWVIFPLVLIGAILLWIFLVIEFAALITRVWRKKSTPVEGIFQRTFSKGNVEDTRLKYYHDRGYIIKFPVWLASKSPFPWLLRYALIRIGYQNKISKDATFIDTIPGLEFTTIKNGATYYPGSSTASHVVDSIFGNLTIKNLTVGENASVFPHTIIGPGVELKKNQALMPRSAGIKDWKGDPNKKFFSGSPGKPIDQYHGILSLLPKKLQTRFHKQGYLLGTEIDRYNVESE